MCEREACRPARGSASVGPPKRGGGRPAGAPEFKGLGFRVQGLGFLG